MIYTGRISAARLSKNPWRAREGRALSHLIGAGGVYVGPVADFSQEKSLPCRFCARKSAGFQQNLVGVAVAGELAPPSTSLSKLF